MCITNACEDPTSAGVWWRDDAEWRQYNAVHAAAILQGIRDRANRVELGNLVSHKYAGGARYVVDLTMMKQMNLASRYARDVKVVRPRAISAAAASNDSAGVKEELRAAAQEVYQIICKLGFHCLAKLKEELFAKLETKISDVKFQAKASRSGVPADMARAYRHRGPACSYELRGYTTGSESTDSGSSSASLSDYDYSSRYYDALSDDDDY